MDVFRRIFCFYLLATSAFFMAFVYIQMPFYFHSFGGYPLFGIAVFYSSLCNVIIHRQM